MLMATHPPMRQKSKTLRPAISRASRVRIWGAALLSGLLVACPAKTSTKEAKREDKLAEVLKCHRDQRLCIPKHIVQDKEGFAEFLKFEKGVKEVDLSKIKVHSPEAALKRLEWLYKGTPVEEGLQRVPLKVFEVPNALLEEAFPGSESAGMHISNTNIVLLNSNDKNMNIPNGFIFTHEVAHYLSWLGGAISSRKMPTWMLEGLTNLSVCRSPGIECNTKFFGDLPRKHEPYAMATFMVSLVELSADQDAYRRAFLYGDFECIEQGFDAKMGEGVFAQFQGEEDIVAAVRFLMRMDKYFYEKFMGKEVPKDGLNAAAYQFFDGLWMIFPKP